jgi:hypothetical protein
MSSFVNTNSDEYEKKIAHLIRNAAKRARQQNPGDFANWLDAIRELKKEDQVELVVCVRSVRQPWRVFAQSRTSSGA